MGVLPGSRTRRINEVAGDTPLPHRTRNKMIRVIRGGVGSKLLSDILPSAPCYCVSVFLVAPLLRYVSPGYCIFLCIDSLPTDKVEVDRGPVGKRRDRVGRYTPFHVRHRRPLFILSTASVGAALAVVKPQRKVLPRRCINIPFFRRFRSNSWGRRIRA